MTESTTATVFIAWHRPPGGTWQKVGSAGTREECWILLAAMRTQLGERAVLPVGIEPRKRFHG